MQNQGDKWPVLLHNHHPAYISWDEFLANQARLAANQNRYQEDKQGVPRKGQALLQGIAFCGRCGARMRLRYSGPHGDFPVYECNYGRNENGSCRCQEVRALGLDGEIERPLLEALAPDKIALALAALEQLEHEHATLSKQWHLRVERTRYEAERAHRQYGSVEPGNHLVARSLEREWEVKLREVEKVEQAYQMWQRQHRLELTAADREDILALGEDLPRLWYAPTTTPADRKQILRLLIKEVILDQKRARGKVWFQINWQTGAVTEHWLVRRLLSLPAVKPGGPHPLRWEDGGYSVEGAAAAVGVFPGTIYKWLKSGRIHGQQLAKGLPWKIQLTDQEIASLQDYTRKVRRSKKEAS